MLSIKAILSVAGVENDRYSPSELGNFTSRVNTVSNELFESTERKKNFDP